MTVELVESPAIEGGIRVNVVASESHQELAPFTDVPVGRDVLLTAKGGNGENGLDGGDGIDGMDGVDGVDATESSDATVRDPSSLRGNPQLTIVLSQAQTAGTVESKFSQL